MRRPSKAAVTALCAGLAVLAGGALWLRAGMPRDPEEEAMRLRINTSTRALSYPVRVERPLLIALQPQDKELKLLSNLLVDEAELARVGPEAQGASGLDQTFVYGLRCRFLDADGRELWRGDYWEETRKTRVQDPGELLPREEAFLPGAEQTPADSRALQLLVGGLIERGARILRIEPLAPGEGAEPPTVLVRALRAVELTDAEAAERWRLLADERRDDVVRRVNLYPSDLLAAGERIDLMRRQWRVIPAEPHDGREHGSVAVYFTDLFETYIPPREELRTSALAGPNRALALNIVGPCNLWVEVGRQRPGLERDLLGGADPSGAPPELWISGVREDAPFHAERVTLEASELARTARPIAIPIPAGPATVTVHPRSFPATVRFYTDEVRQLGDVEVTPVVGRLAPGGYTEVRPDVRASFYFDAASAESGDPPVEAEVVHTPGPGDTEVRLAARALLPPERARADHPIRLAVEHIGAGGEVLRTDELAALRPSSLHDWLWHEDEERLLLSEAEYFTVRCAPEVERLRVRAEEPTLVALFARPQAQERLTEVPEDYPLSPEVRSAWLRGGRLRSPEWYYYRPLNHHALRTHGREHRVMVQRRLLERRPPAEDVLRISNFGRRLSLFADPPDGADAETPAEVELLMRADDTGERAVLARPRDRFEVRPFADERLRVTDPIHPDNPLPVPVDLLATRHPDDEGDAVLAVFLDGRRVHEGLVPPGVSSASLGALPLGERPLRVELYRRAPGEEAFLPASPDDVGPGAPVRVFASQPVLDAGGDPDAGRLYQVRSVAPLQPGRPLAVEVVKAGPDPVTVNAQLVTRAARDGVTRDRVEVTLTRIEPPAGDGDAPARATVEERAFSVARADVQAALGLDGRPLGDGRAFFVGLRPELPAGRYRVTFALPDDAPPDADVGPRYLRAAVVDPRRVPLTDSYWPRFNLKGPVTLRVALDADALRARRKGTVRLLQRVQGIDAVEPLEERIARVPAEGPLHADIDVPAGLHTVTVGLPGGEARARYLLVDRYLDAVAGIQAVHVPADVAAALPLELQPDEVLSTFYRLAPGDAPLRFPIDAAAMGPLRISAARPITGIEAARGQRFAYRVRFRDAAGEDLGASRIAPAVETTRAVRDLDDPKRIASDPAVSFLAAPPDAAAVELEAEGAPVLVRLQRLAEPDAVRADVAGPRVDGPERLDWRGLERLRPPWLAVAPLDAAARAARGSRRTLVQARERVGDAPSPDAAGGRARSLVPEGAAARRRLLEPLGRGAIPSADRWADNLYVALRAHDRAIIQVLPEAWAREGAAEPAAAADLLLLYDLGDAMPDGEVEVRIDGESALRFLPIEPRGRVRLRDVPAGERTLSIAAPTPDARFYVNRPPRDLAAASPYRERVVYEIRGGAPLLFEVDKPEGTSVFVHGALYLDAPAPPGAVLDVGIEVPADARRAGAAEAWTWTERRLHLTGGAPIDAVDLERFEPAPRFVHPFMIPLQEDLHGGRLQVRLRLEGVNGGEVRLLIIDPSGLPRERVRMEAYERTR